MWVPVDAKFKIKYPNSLFLTLVSLSEVTGNFDIGYKYINAPIT